MRHARTRCQSGSVCPTSDRVEPSIYAKQRALNEKMDIVAIERRRRKEASGRLLELYARMEKVFEQKETELERSNKELDERIELERSLADNVEKLIKDVTEVWPWRHEMTGG